MLPKLVIYSTAEEGEWLLEQHIITMPAWQNKFFPQAWDATQTSGWILIGNSTIDDILG